MVVFTGNWLRGSGETITRKVRAVNNLDPGHLTQRGEIRNYRRGGNIPTYPYNGDQPIQANGLVKKLGAEVREDIQNLREYLVKQSAGRFISYKTLLNEQEVWLIKIRNTDILKEALAVLSHQGFVFQYALDGITILDSPRHEWSAQDLVEHRLPIAGLLRSSEKKPAPHKFLLKHTAAIFS